MDWCGGCMELGKSGANRRPPQYRSTAMNDRDHTRWGKGPSGAANDPGPRAFERLLLLRLLLLRLNNVPAAPGLW